MEVLLSAVTNIKTLKITLSATNTPQQVFPSTGSRPKFQLIKFHALSTNSGVTYLGDSSVSQTAQQGDPLAANAVVEWRLEQLIAAEQIYLSGTINDVVAITYFEVK